MAHRGRAFPVHFRRDFNRNGDILHWNPIANEYRLTLRTFFPGMYPLDGTIWDLLPVPMPSVSTLQWDSVPRSIAGKIWSTRLTIDYNALPDSTLRALWYVLRAGTVASVFKFADPRYDDPTYHDFFEQATVYYDPAIFTIGDPGFWLSYHVAIGY